MRTFILSTLLLSVLLTSCNGNKTNETETKESEALKPFTVTFNAIVAKDDVFQIFYNEDGKDVFAPENAVTISVKGSEQPQDLVFEIPSDVSPMSLRFDIGANKLLKQVPFNSFKIEYKDKKIEGKKAEFFKYFYPNTQVEIDTLNVTAKMKDLGEGYDPILGSTVELKKEIEKLYK